MNAIVDFFDTYGSVEGRKPIQTSEIPFTYDQVFDFNNSHKVDNAVRKLVNVDFEGQGIIFNPGENRLANFKF